MSLAVPLVLTAAHVSLAVIHSDFYGLNIAFLAVLGVVSFSTACCYATHQHIQRLACVTLGITLFLILEIIALPIRNPDWRGDRLHWFHDLTPMIILGSILGFVASYWSPIRSHVDAGLAWLLSDRTRVLSWGASVIFFYFASAATFTFKAPQQLLQDGYSTISPWLPHFSFRATRAVHAIMEIPVTLMFVIGLPAIIILFVGADTIRDRTS